MNTWLTYGPFDLSDATAASVSFYYWAESEARLDLFRCLASHDGVNHSGPYWSGNNAAWSSYTLDLAEYCGQQTVHVAFVFQTDGFVQSEEAWVDDVVISKTAALSAELEWASMTLSSTNWTPGQSITATLTELNSGAGTAGPHHSQVYLSTDGTITTADTPMGDAFAVGIIASDGQAATDYTFTVPTVSAGSYYIGVLVDVYNQVAETDETSNGGVRSGKVQVQGSADLRWTTLALSSTDWTPGQSVTATLTETNQGSFTAGAHHSQIYLSTDFRFIRRVQV